MAKAVRLPNPTRASVEAFNPADWIRWDEALVCGERFAGSIPNAGYELEAARRSGKVRVLARYAAPDGNVRWRKLPDLMRFYEDGWIEMKWIQENQKPGSKHCTVWAHRADVQLLWPSAEQPTAPIDSPDEPPKHKPGRKKVYDPEFVEREAWAYVYEYGCPASLEALATDLKVTVGEGIPEVTKAKEFLGRAYDRMEQLRNHMGEKSVEKRPRRRH